MIKKHLGYASYVLRHRWYVLVECVKLGIPIQGLTHDLSKFLPDEWVPYADYFYGYLDSLNPGGVRRDGYHTRAQEKAFDFAWLRHQHRNPHHPQHWRLLEDSGETRLLPMPEKYVREMLADWRGAGRAIAGRDDIREWYTQNYDKIELEAETRAVLHSIMKPSERPLPRVVRRKEKAS